MFKKFVKDRAHNRHEAYCCEDIDKLIGALQEAVAALTAGTVPDGAVTLAKLAEDARSWSREINKGLLVAEWIGTEAEYEAHLAANGGKPLANVKYNITDKKSGCYAQFATGTAFPLGSFVTVVEKLNGEDLTVFPHIGETQGNIYIAKKTTADGELILDSYAVRTYSEAAERIVVGDGLAGVHGVGGTWRMCGISGMRDDPNSTNMVYCYEIWQKIAESVG